MFFFGSVSHLIFSCPHLVVIIGGVSVPCLIDTGSMVSTITESCLRSQFDLWGQDRLRSCHWLQLRTANELEIPYIGYTELDVELCGQVVSECGRLMVDTPVRQRYRRIPPSEYELVKIYIGQLLDTQVIWESCSPYTSLVILVKKDGSLCMCVEYCELNSKTWKDAFTLPRIEETLYSLTGACWFTSLDLASWYSHVPVAESDHHKTVFVHLFGCLNRIACPSA